MSEPILQLEARDAVRVNGSWRVRWRVTNVGGEHVRLVAVRAPHSRFRADPVDLNVVVVESAAVEQTLRIEAAPGEEIENAFVIFVVVKEHETWRVLFRVRVLVGADGTPAPAVEAMSTHRVGFAEA
jgi:hypothetical protein